MKREIAHSTPTRAKHGHIGDRFGWVLQLPELGQSRRPDLSAASRLTTNTIDGHLAGHLPYRRPRCWPFASHIAGFPTGHLARHIAGSATEAILHAILLACLRAISQAPSGSWVSTSAGRPHVLGMGWLTRATQSRFAAQRRKTRQPGEISLMSRKLQPLPFESRS